MGDEWDVVEEERLCRIVDSWRIVGTSMETDMFGVVLVVTKGCQEGGSEAKRIMA